MFIMNNIWKCYLIECLSHWLDRLVSWLFQGLGRNNFLLSEIEMFNCWVTMKILPLQWFGFWKSFCRFGSSGGKSLCSPIRTIYMYKARNHVTQACIEIKSGLISYWKKAILFYIDFAYNYFKMKHILITIIAVHFRIWYLFYSVLFWSNSKQNH